MRNPFSRSTLISAAVAATLGFGVVPQAAALPGVFEVSPDSLGLTGYNPFNADQIAGTSSVLLQATSSTTVTGAGWINFTAFTLLGQNILAGTSGINLGGTNSYALYLTFDIASSLDSGTINTPGSSGHLTMLNFTLYADVGSDSKFTVANATTSTAASVVQNTADKKLATGSLISGVNGLNDLGGAFINSVTTINLTTDGENYFTAPVPFYTLAFSQFNNTSQGIAINGNLLSINQETGSVDFNKVPEPASLALVGLGLLGMGVVRRRKQESK